PLSYVHHPGNSPPHRTVSALIRRRLLDCIIMVWKYRSGQSVLMRQMSVPFPRRCLPFQAPTVAPAAANFLTVLA
uniref:Uncharacterized protein n=1 Tax=Oryza brachyantha TaxID=4533 RepID=J3M7B1_ORYBR